jgi:hypothetical protein
MTHATVHALPTLSVERLRELREAGIAVETNADLSELGLREPAYGEEVVGRLTPEEIMLFRDLFRANEQLEDMSRTALGRSLAVMGQAIQNSDRGKTLHDALSTNKDLMVFDNATEEKSFFRTQQRQTALHATFYWHLGERLDAHEWRLGVRAGGRVVKVERR